MLIICALHDYFLFSVGNGPFGASACLPRAVVQIGLLETVKNCPSSTVCVLRVPFNPPAPKCQNLGLNYVRDTPTP